ncbi:MAG TPA: hypothetical protein VFB54_18200 [Burkholderiales bacterium]|nr:hypothetical protein [Burkholderiales bacterium]
MTDNDFVAAVEACALAKEEFRHADHIRLAWNYLRRAGFCAGSQLFIATLQRFAAHHGVPLLYHETITWAYLALINERIQRGGAVPDWECFRSSNADLFETQPSVLDCYYSTELLGSDLARRAFLLPDLPRVCRERSVSS